MPLIDPSMMPVGPEWSIGAIETGGLGSAETSSAESASGGFGAMLGKQIQNLAETQTEGAHASAALASGTAEDPASVVMAVERARLSMQLASQLRTKGVEAMNDIFHTQV